MRGAPRKTVVALAALLAAGGHLRAARAAASTPRASARTLRVCADPNNLPFSNERREGFENELAALIARDLRADLSFFWWPQRRGFLRNTLNAGRCDVVMGLPAGFERVLTTRPVYRSTYALVLGPGAPPVRSLDDPALRTLRIGVPLVGDDGSNPPPVAALVQRGLVSNLHGYPVYGDYGDADPGAAIVRAVRDGDVDLAITWGPFAGYYAGRFRPRLRVVPLRTADAPAGLPFAFDMAIAVRKGDERLQRALDRTLARRRPEIDRLLSRYRVPRP